MSADVDALKKKLELEKQKNSKLSKSLKEAVNDKFLYAQEQLPGMGEDTKGITLMQYRYAMLRAQYPKNGTYTDKWCAIKAGYAEKDAKQAATKVNNHPQVKKIIDRANAQQVADLGLDAGRVIGDVMTLADVAIGRQPYVVSMKNKETGKVSDVLMTGFDTSTALKANELLGKHLKLWTDKIEHGGEGGAPIQVAREVHYVNANNLENTKEALGVSDTE